VAAGVAVGVIQLLASLVCVFAAAGLFGAMSMGGPSGDGFMNAFAFAGGVLAKANGWIEQPLPSSIVRPAAGYATASLVLVFLFFFLTVAPSAPAGAGGWFPLCFFALQIPLSAYCPCILVLGISFFQTALNFTNAFMRFLARASFSVFLVHYIFIAIFSYVYVLILEQTQAIDITFVNSTSTSTDVGGDGYTYSLVGSSSPSRALSLRLPSEGSS
jgi:peptidoglycan/LPS O-acetylase OafA/YrhL